MTKIQSLTSDQWRVVLYLSHFSRFIDDAESPPQVTAGGIVQTTGLKRSRVDEVLKELIREGYVRAWSNHVKGEPAKRKIHFLTREGENLASFITDAIRGTQVSIKDEEIDRILGLYSKDEAGTKECPIESKVTPLHRLEGVRGRKIPLLSAGRLFDFVPTTFELVMGLEDDRTLSIESVKQAHSKAIAMRPVKEWVDFAGHVHKCMHFHGREREVALAEEFLESVTQQVMIIKGIDGIGKTSLAAAIISMVRGSRHLFWYDHHDHTTLKHLLNSMALFLGKLKVPTLRNYLNSEDRPDVKEVMHMLEASLYDTSVMMVFEDVHKINDEQLLLFFRELKDAVGGMMGAKVIITGRTIPPFYDKKDIQQDGVMTEIPLAGLDDASTAELLQSEGVAKNDLREHLNIVKGHPMYAELVANLGMPSGPKTINFYVEADLDGHLSDVEKKLLCITSVYRHPVPTKALLKRADRFKDGTEGVPGQDTVESLKDKGILRSDAYEENLSLHDIIRDHFYDRMAPKNRRMAHAIAAAYYVEEREDVNRLEVLYHFIMAEEHEKAATYAVDKKAVLFRTGYLDEVLALVRKIDRGLLPSDMMLSLALLEGEIHMRTGQVESALKVFTLATKMAGQIGNDVMRAHALFQLGEVLRRKGLLDEARACYDQGMDILETEGGPEDLAKGHYGLAVIQYAQGHLDEACARYQKALEEARKGRDLPTASAVVTNMGECLLKRGDVGKAMDLLRENLKMIEINRDSALISKAHSTLGLIYSLKEDWARANNSFQMGIQEARQSGNRKLLAANLTEGAIPLMRKGEEERAEESLEEAQEIYTRLGDKSGEAQVELKRAELYMLGDDQEASEESYRAAIRSLEALGANDELSSAYIGLAAVLEKMGRENEAAVLRKKSMEGAMRSAANGRTDG
jgi:tetratricopeptide (TPR) repeat protein/DNA-binding MarR family transcriptional regulator